MEEMTPLEKKRLALGVNQSEMASRIGVPLTTYNGWENGKRRPSAEFYPKLAQAFGIPTEDVVELINSTPRQVAKPVAASR